MTGESGLTHSIRVSEWTSVNPVVNGGSGETVATRRDRHLTVGGATVQAKKFRIERLYPPKKSP